jgi:hypothetical protein
MNQSVQISGPVGMCQLRVHADGNVIDYEIFGDIHNSAKNYCTQCDGPLCPVDIVNIVDYINQEIETAELTEGAPFLHVLYEGTQAGCPVSSEPYPLDQLEATFCGKKGTNYQVHDIDIRKEGILGVLEENATMLPFLDELRRMNHSWTQTLSIFLECHLHATNYQQCFRNKLPTVPFEDKDTKQDALSVGGPSRIRRYTHLLNSSTQRRIRAQWRTGISENYLLNGMYLSSCIDNDTNVTFEERICFINPNQTRYDDFMVIVGSVLMEWYTIILSLSTIDTNGNPIQQPVLPRAKKVIIYVGEAHQFHIIQFLKRLYPSNTTMTIIQDSSSDYYKHTKSTADDRSRCVSKITIPRTTVRSKQSRPRPVDDHPFGTYERYECIDNMCAMTGDGHFKSLEECQKKCHSSQKMDTGNN